MTLADTTAQSQSDSLSLEFDLRHAPEKVWRALTDPVLLAEWLLPSVDLVFVVINDAWATPMVRRAATPHPPFREC